MSEKYVCIENDGEVDLRSFFIMGMGHKEEGDDFIGQFGTGSKYGITAVMREGCTVTVYSGVERIDFKTVKENFRDRKFNKLVIKYNDEYIETGITLEMGKIKWDIKAGLKEIVSNAIDEGGFEKHFMNKRIGVVGKTRVFIDNRKKVREFFDDFNSYFTIHRSPEHKGNGFRLYERMKPGVRVFRKGVLVFEDQEESAFDYDLDEMDVNENRLSSRYECYHRIGGIMNELPVEAKEKVLQVVFKHGIVSSLEGSIDMSYKLRSEDWVTVCEGKIIVTEEQYKAHQRKLISHDTVVVPTHWAEYLLKHDKINGITSVLNNIQLRGWEEVMVDDSYIEHLIEKTVNFIKLFDYRIEIDDIVVANNSDPRAPMGQLIDGKYYINRSVFKKGFDEVFATIMEEMFHKLSGAADHTREFQDFIFYEMFHYMKELAFHRGGKEHGYFEKEVSVSEV